jgi:hypothetical protein
MMFSIAVGPPGNRERWRDECSDTPVARVRNRRVDLDDRHVEVGYISDVPVTNPTAKRLEIDMPNTSSDGTASSPAGPRAEVERDPATDESIQELDEDLPPRLAVDPGTTGTKG